MFIVLASVAFVLIVTHITSFKISTMEEKEASDFRMGVLNILQKLFGDKECLAYGYDETSRKIVLDKSKLDVFATQFDGIEPECAKALDFDYSIRIIQFPLNFSVYPREITIGTEPEYATDFAQHQCYVGSGKVLYVRCNFLPSEETCESGELDPGGILPICDKGCFPDPLKKCPYPDHERCCIPYYCPAEKCECTENMFGQHPWIVTCDDADLEKDCTPLRHAHSWCGKVSKIIVVPAGESVSLDIASMVWNFGLSTKTGIKSFSPGTALKEELDISIPVTIRYNETFSAEGFAYVHAVRGELESLYSLLEDICDKAEEGLNVQFSRDFHFSYPVSYTAPNLCMMNSCKKFVCSFDLDFEEITAEGDYLLKFSVDQNNKQIIVRK